MALNIKKIWVVFQYAIFKPKMVFTVCVGDYFNTDFFLSKELTVSRNITNVSTI